MAEAAWARAEPAAATEAAPTGPDWQAGGEPIVLPQSYEQEWFYLRHMMYPAESFPLWLGYDIEGPLDVKAFSRAIDDVIARQHAMRAVFFADGHGQLYQRIAKSIRESGVNYQRVICESRRQFDMYTRALAKNDGRLLWDLSHEPAYRLHLLQYSEREHVFLATLHHIAFDLTSLQILERELWTCYAHHAYGCEAPVPAGDLVSAIRRQHQRYYHRVKGANAEYWRQQTALAPPLWQRAASAGMARSQLIDRISFSTEYDRRFVERLRETCRQLGCSVFELCLCAFSWLAFQLSYQDRVAVYVIFDSRIAEEGDVMGMFSGAHPVVLRRPDGSARSFLGQVRKQSLRVLVHRHVSADEAISAAMRQWSRWQTQPKRALAINYITIGDRDPRRLMPADLRIDRRSRRSLDATIGAAPDSMALVVREYDNKLEAFIEYNPNSLSKNLVRDVMTAFGHSLRSTVDAGDVVLTPPAGVSATAPVPVPDRLTPLLDADGVACMHVDCSEVRAILLNHPSVESADVRVEKHADGGSEVTAYLRTRADVDDDEVRRFCREWPAASAFAVVPSRILVTGPVGARGGGAGDDRSRALLALMAEVLPGAQPESEFWAAGGSFSAISEMARRARRAGLPEPSAADFASPRTLTAAADAILSRAAG
jgi:Condensation domain